MNDYQNPYGLKCKCGKTLYYGCCAWMCPDCKKLYLFNSINGKIDFEKIGAEVKEDGSNYFMRPSDINWEYLK